VFREPTYSRRRLPIDEATSALPALWPLPFSSPYPWNQASSTPAARLSSQGRRQGSQGLPSCSSPGAFRRKTATEPRFWVERQGLRLWGADTAFDSAQDITVPVAHVVPCRPQGARCQRCRYAANSKGSISPIRGGEQSVKKNKDVRGKLLVVESRALHVARQHTSNCIQTGPTLILIRECFSWLEGPNRFPRARCRTSSGIGPSPQDHS
jgi:hypothetical protein